MRVRARVRVRTRVRLRVSLRVALAYLVDHRASREADAAPVGRERVDRLDLL